MIDVLRSSISAEWLKIRSVRSSYWVIALVLGVVAAAAVFAWIGVRGWDDLPPQRRARFQAPAMEQVFLPLVQLCLAILGVLAVTSEYATRSITASLTVRPQRTRLALAKAIVVAGVSLTAGSVFLAGAFSAGRGIVGDRRIPPGYVTSVAEELPTLFWSGLGVGAAGLLGLAAGLILRTTASAVMAMVALLLIAPAMIRFLPGSWQEHVSLMLLPTLPERIADGSVAAAIVLVAYLAVAFGGAVLALNRRDVP